MSLEDQDCIRFNKPDTYQQCEDNIEKFGARRRIWWILMMILEVRISTVRPKTMTKREAARNIAI